MTKELSNGRGQISPDDWIEIGRFGAPHGVKGWLKFQAFLEDPHLCFRLMPWYFKSSKAVVPVVQAWKTQGKKFLVQLQGIQSCEAASLFTNHHMVVVRKQLPPLPEDEYYWHELIGANVVNHRQEYLGKVMDFLDLGPHAVLVVEDPDTAIEHLIPFIQGEIVLKLSNHDMVVLWEKDY